MAANEAGPLYQGAFGRRDVENGPAMTSDTVFRIASMTKAITSVAAMQLVEEDGSVSTRRCPISASRP